MKEINVLSLFGAVEKAQAAANKTGKGYSVRLSDFAEKPRAEKPEKPERK